MALSSEQKSYLKNLSPRAKACKAYRRHPFPVIVPGEPIPAGVLVRAVTGGIDVTYICPNCGRQKIEQLGANGILGWGVNPPKYAGGEGGDEPYLAPKGLGLKIDDYRGSYSKDVAGMIKKAAR